VTLLSTKKGEEAKIRIWDLPVRLFHWLIVALFAFSWWTAENDLLDWHMRSGYAILVLILFRIYWGFAGSTTARFQSFLKGPKAFFAYARHIFDRPSHISLGHNPMGGWSVVILLLLLLTQTILGLFAVDVDGVYSGPLGNLVTFDTARLITKWHGRVFNYLLIFTGLHVAVIAFYLLYKRENLIGAMTLGYKRISGGFTGAPLRFRPLLWAVPGLLISILIVLWIVYGHF
jgi:cytochrome b